LGYFISKHAQIKAGLNDDTTADESAVVELGSPACDKTTLKQLAANPFATFSHNAELGDAHSQYQLGLLYRDGLGASKDTDTAMTWLRKAAAQSFAPANHALGQLYSTLKRVDEAEEAYIAAAKAGHKDSLLHVGKTIYPLSERHHSGALKAFLTAADLHNDAEAQFYVAEMVHLGRGIPHPYSLQDVIFWYKRSADLGNATAKNNLAAVMEDNKPSSDQFRQIQQLYQLAAEDGVALGMMNMARLHHLGLATPRSQTPEQNLADAVPWYLKAALHGMPEAQLMLGTMYEHGVVVPQDAQAAVHTIRLAADQEHPAAIAKLAGWYSTGFGTVLPQCNQTSKQYYQKLNLTMNDPEALNALGEAYQDGKVEGKPDPVSAYNHFTRASQYDHEKACRNLGLMLYYGADPSPRQNHRRAAHYFERASENAFGKSGRWDAYSLMMRGMMYLNGEWYRKDPDKAMQFFLKAAASGDPDVIRDLKPIAEYQEYLQNNPDKLPRPLSLMNAATHYIHQPPFTKPIHFRAVAVEGCKKLDPATMSPPRPLQGVMADFKFPLPPSSRPFQPPQSTEPTPQSSTQFTTQSTPPHPFHSTAPSSGTAQSHQSSHRQFSTWIKRTNSPLSTPLSTSHSTTLTPAAMVTLPTCSRRRQPLAHQQRGNISSISLGIHTSRRPSSTLHSTRTVKPSQQRPQRRLHQSPRQAPKLTK
jgi:TPR repeat protein